MGFRYSCDLCGKIIDADDVRAHIEEHKAQPDWPGKLELKLADEEPSDGS